MVSRSYAFLALLLLAVTAVSFSHAKAADKEGEMVEPMSFFHKKHPFHKYPPIKKLPLPPIPVVVIKKHPLPPISIPVIKKKPFYHPHPFPVIKKKPITIPKFSIPKPVYVHPSIPKFTNPKKKPCPPIFKKPSFPPHAGLP